MNTNTLNSALSLLKKISELEITLNVHEVTELREEAVLVLRDYKLSMDCRTEEINDWNMEENGNAESFERNIGFGGENAEQMYVTISDNRKNPIIDVIVEINQGLPTVHICQGGGDTILSAMANTVKNELVILDGGTMPEDGAFSIITDIRMSNEKGIAYKLR